jgi:hypothetical protein
MRPPLALPALLASFATSSHAATYSISTTDQGWIQSTGDHGSTNTNYIVGTNPNTFRNFFIFTLPSIAPNEEFVSATISIYNPSGGYSSGDPTEHYTLSSVDYTAISTFFSNMSGNISAFNDLGDGTIFGEKDIDSTTNNQTINIALNQAFLNAANSALAGSGQIALGGQITTLDANTSNTEFVFGFSGDTAVTMTFTTAAVPEPSSAILVLIGAGGLLRRRRTS